MEWVGCVAEGDALPSPTQACSHPESKLCIKTGTNLPRIGQEPAGTFRYLRAQSLDIRRLLRVCLSRSAHYRSRIAGTIYELCRLLVSLSTKTVDSQGAREGAFTGGPHATKKKD